MAEKVVITLSSDTDVEPDGEACNSVMVKLGDHFKHTSDITPVKSATESKSGYTTESHSEQCDSGVVSMTSGSTELKSVDCKPTTCFTDKTPIQCSNCNTSDPVTIEMEKNFGKLCVSDNEDEGNFSMSSRSVDSLASEVPIEESRDIVVDLFEQDEDGDTIIHVAIVSLLDSSAIVLIEAADDINCLNIQNYLQQSPLHLAVHTRQVQIVKSLIAKGANVTLRDRQGNTPLHIACRKGDKDAVSAIVQSFGNNTMSRAKYFSIKNCEGLTCVHVAAQHKEFIILGHLFAKGADVNIGDAKSGRTMLHYAVERNDTETVALLLTHPNIDVECETFNGETSLVLAYWRNYQNIVKRLKSKGAYFSYDTVEDSDDENTS